MDCMASFIHIKKDALKFSAAHMTVFPDGTKESLHGHNYRVELKVEVAGTGLKEMVPFSEIKRETKKLCDQWDEKLLLAEKCPFFKVLSKSNELSFELCKKKYLIPTDETLLLPLENITSEGLAQVFHEILSSKINKKGIKSLRVRIDEMTGQGGSYEA
jgi:6-pyruvoyltetrahydropterin/6-carboxytetrahydropterin synthase